MNEPLHAERHATALELTLNRPARRNALSAELVVALTRAFRDADADAQLRSVILTGSPPAFCAGLDLHEVAQSASAAAAHDTTQLLDLYETIERLSKPVIAAINGPAVAGGAILACVCDVVLCSESAQLGFPGIRRGLVAPIVMPVLVEMVGQQRAKYLLLTGELLPASRAAAFGLVHEVVADAELLARARRHAAQFATSDPTALAETKSLLGRLRNSGDQCLSAERRRLTKAVPLTDAARAGVAEFLQGGA